MDIATLLDVSSIHTVEDIRFDSRLIHRYMVERKTSSKQRHDFTYPVFHRRLMEYFAPFGTIADVVVCHADGVEYAILGRLEAVKFLSSRYPDVDVEFFVYVKRLESRCREQAATITTLETEKAAARMILETQLPVALEQMDEVGDLIAALPYSKNRQRAEDKWTDAYASLKAVRTKLAVTHGVTAPPPPEALRAEAEAAEERRLNKTPINIPLQFGFSRGGKK